MRPVSDTTFIIRVATLGAIFTMAYQVAGKAARDALFLSSFRPHNLPPMIVAAAVSAILLGLLNSRLLTRYAPGRFIPALTFLSGVLQIAEWAVYRDFPHATAVAVYIHVVALGAVINSGFWSVLNEQFDPRTAKRAFSTIAAAGTAGGVAGGFLAERLGALATAESVLLAMGVVQLLTAVLLHILPPTPPPAPREQASARDVLRSSSYLRTLTALVLAGTFAAALLDFVLKSDARHALGPGEPLLRFFAMYHTGTSLLAFLVQTGLTNFFLNRFGLGATVATLPASVTAGGFLAAISGGLPAVVAARAVEAIIRGSLFRAGYELLYTPMLPWEKRSVKSINDVAVDRLGDALGGGFAQIVILTGSAASRIMLIAASIVSGIGWLLALRLHAGYVRSLERSLSHHSTDLDPPASSQITQGFSQVVTSMLDTIRTLSGPPPPWVSKRGVRLYTDLKSGEAARICDALSGHSSVERALLPFVIPLLAERPVRDCVRRALETVASPNVGLLTDWMLDAKADLQVRSSIPRILAFEGSPRAVEGLLLGLADRETAVRLRCGKALSTLRIRTEIDLNPEPVYAAVRDELLGYARGDVPKVDLRLLAALLAVILPQDPVRIAFEALETDDRSLRGLAFEYLETVLPPDIAEPLLAVLDADVPGQQQRRPEEAVRTELMRVTQQLKQQTQTLPGT